LCGFIIEKFPPEARPDAGLRFTAGRFVPDIQCLMLRGEQRETIVIKLLLRKTGV